MVVRIPKGHGGQGDRDQGTVRPFRQPLGLDHLPGGRDAAQVRQHPGPPLRGYLRQHLADGLARRASVERLAGGVPCAYPAVEVDDLDRVARRLHERSEAAHRLSELADPPLQLVAFAHQTQGVLDRGRERSQAFRRLLLSCGAQKDHGNPGAGLDPRWYDRRPLDPETGRLVAAERQRHPVTQGGLDRGIRGDRAGGRASALLGRPPEADPRPSLQDAEDHRSVVERRLYPPREIVESLDLGSSRPRTGGLFARGHRVRQVLSNARPLRRLYRSAKGPASVGPRVPERSHRRDASGEPPSHAIQSRSRPKAWRRP
jgi:hypothetical protein